jgi:osmotically-inducible protein OsmY
MTMLAENTIDVLPRPTLGPPNTQSLFSHSPREIERKAIQSLEHHSHFRGRHVWLQCTCREGNLYLSGKLPSFHLKQVAQEVVRRVEGVRTVVNEIVVASPEGEIGCECSRLQPYFSSQHSNPQ